MDRVFVLPVVDINAPLKLNNGGEFVFSRRAAYLWDLKSTLPGRITIGVHADELFVGIDELELILTRDPKQASCFIARPVTDYESISLESADFPGFFLRSSRQKLVLCDQLDSLSELETSFRILDEAKRIVRYTITTGMAIFDSEKASIPKPVGNLNSEKLSQQLRSASAIPETGSLSSRTHDDIDLTDEHWSTSFYRLQSRITQIQEQLQSAVVELQKQKNDFSAQQKHLRATAKENQMWRELYQNH